MAEVASRQLRNDTRGVLRRVEGGEDVTITVDGRPVAVLRPVSTGTRWVARSAFLRLFGEAQADAGLSGDLRDLLGGETTDDLGW